jgi:hypothetical protein
VKKPARDKLTKLADAAFLVASHKVVDRAEQTGTKIVIWEDGGVKKIEPSEARARLAKIKKPGRKR